MMGTPSQDPVRRLAGHYSHEAQAYAELWGPRLAPYGRELVRELASLAPSPGRVLDVGTGTGGLLVALAEAFPGAKFMGVDRSEGMLRLVPKSHAVAVMDGARLGVASNCIDVAVLAFVLFHFPEPSAAIEEVF